MSVWSRLPAEKRDSSTLRSLGQVGALFKGGGTYADVDGGQTGQALQVIAIRSAMDLIASLCSELPVHTYRGTGSAREQVEKPRHFADPDGSGHGMEDWVYQLAFSWLARGNAYGEVLDRRGGVATQVAWQNPDKVTGALTASGAVSWHIGGKLVTDPSKFLHLRVNPVPGCVQGLSPIEMHASTIGVSLASTRFGKQWFSEGAHPSGMLTNTEVDLDQTQIRKAKDIFLAALWGTREPVVMGKGWDYKALQLTPEQSQFLQTQGYSSAECARMFGPGVAETLGYESGGNLTYANVESRSTHLLVYSLGKWLRRVERVLTAMIPGDDTYVRVDRDALLQSTTLERYRAHESRLRNRWATVNEVRADEDLPPVEWGDEPNLTYVGQSFTGEQDPAGDNESTGAEAPAPTGGNS